MSNMVTMMANRNVNVAVKTLVAIEQAIEADQGSAFRGWLGKVIPHMDDAYRTGEDGFRSHMGASLIGGECARAIWYGFNWATKPRFKGTTLRLFNRGHLEEARMIACLLTIGCRVYQQDENGKQFRISAMGGHYGGSGDGVALRIPDLLPDVAALLEFKTHNDASFIKLAGKNFREYFAALCMPDAPRVEFTGEGVRAAKFEHYVQMQQYMRKMGLAVALYVAVNKNNDLLYAEIVTLDTAVADQFLERAHKIVPIRTAPAKMNESPGFYKCKWCDHYGPCHQKKAPERNCRTCTYSRPNTYDGKWYCLKGAQSEELPKEKQLVGCNDYDLNATFR